MLVSAFSVVDSYSFVSYIFLSFFIFFTVVWTFFASATLFHLKKYTMPGWSSHRVVIPVFLCLSFIFFAFALYFLFQIS
ncbi:MAG: hypothetical protein A2934_01615 [Candidatus Sungbacteria bacterium RIFCSPLOWO2_01_FULL_47_10]|uniref:Uncharacterized protein n=1 Tax=Candidatus Sungbacteria bacterium RIFCSPLOWO2_01_FULL_47_10 TaxID=1802276 RepID=A0A1G2L9T0_9BACT|nr:MAG: hypothetical protein A2934_01615 [Candidatus Sungbacteria bacterium RIFCSPLOWO2_01_FULL_47_10]